MVPRFSLSARDAVQHARSLHAFTSAHARIQLCEHASDRENAFHNIPTELPARSANYTHKRVTRKGEPAPSVEGQVSIVLVVSIVLE